MLKSACFQVYVFIARFVLITEILKLLHSILFVCSFSVQITNDNLG